MGIDDWVFTGMGIVALWFLFTIAHNVMIIARRLK